MADLQRSCAAEKEAVLQQSELSHFRALEEERNRCEERERCLCDDLAEVEEELRATGRPTVDTTIWLL